MRIRLILFILILATTAAAQVVRTINDGNLTFFVHNNGTFGYDPYATRNNISGLYYPGDSRRGIMAGGGIWVAGKVGGDWRVTISGDESEFVPGPRRGEGAEVDSAFPIYKITRGENYDLNDDYQNWPVGLGAPINALGQPLQIGSQNLWTMFNDGDSASHVFQGFSSVQPLSVEVRLHAYTWDNNYQLYDTMMAQVIFLDYTITNVSDSTIDSCIISIYADPDIGFSRNDRFGTNPLLQAAYIYDEADFDSDYGDYPPVVGMTMLRNRALSANYYYGCSSQYPECIPVDTLPEVVNLINGLRANGLPYFDPITSLPKRYPFDGNPSDSSGWIADLSRDYRFLLNTIPDTLLPGESIELTAALVVARGNSTRDGVGKWLEFVGRLRDIYSSDTLVAKARTYYEAWSVTGRVIPGNDWGGRFMGGGLDYAGRYLDLPYVTSGIWFGSIGFHRDEAQMINRYAMTDERFTYRGKVRSNVVFGFVEDLPQCEGIFLDLDNDGSVENSIGGLDPILSTTMFYSDSLMGYINSELSAVSEKLTIAVEFSQSADELVGSILKFTPLPDVPTAILNDTLNVSSEPPADAFAERTLSFTNTTDFATEINIVTDDPLYLTASPPQLQLGAGETKISFLTLSGRRTDTTPIGVSVYSHGLTQSSDRFIVKYTPANMASGDLNRDQYLSVADIVEMLRVLYRGAPINVPLRVVDANCDSRFNLVDLMFFLNHLFEGAPLPCLE